MQTKTSKKILVFSIILFFLSCSFFVFTYKEIENNIKISKQLQTDLEKEASRREEIKDFNESFKSIEKEKELFETHFIQSSDVVPFLNTIEKMAGSVNTKAEVSFLEVSQDNTGLILEMKDQGSFLGIYKFIMLLENSPYELEINSVEMHTINVENKKNKEWEANLKIKLISFL